MNAVLFFPLKGQKIVFEWTLLSEAALKALSVEEVEKFAALISLKV